ncbi:MAG TPA: 2-C-methyl-D-erythritol 2,4-cyclodiphosphate synthase [Patescibacteria group bacterium]|nr:2-C-methyl-D-erythritol 2,4-cyclodiphosphate synthase [Patescibacteria group bacterium]
MDSTQYRIGIGYDIHPLVEGRRLVLGGVTVEYEKGLAGHSDADVLIHALCDALLGALNLGDLGEHFPETEEYRDISSIKILDAVAGMVAGNGYHLVNADCIVHAERPRLAVYRGRMAERMAAALGVDAGVVSVKATRGEGMGPVGEGKAIAAQAVVLVAPLAGK